MPAHIEDQIRVVRFMGRDQDDEKVELRWELQVLAHNGEWRCIDIVDEETGEVVHVDKRIVIVDPPEKANDEQI